MIRAATQNADSSSRSIVPKFFCATANLSTPRTQPYARSLKKKLSVQQVYIKCWPTMIALGAGWTITEHWLHVLVQGFVSFLHGMQKQVA